MGWVTAVEDDLILAELEWWATFSSLYLGQGRRGSKSRELSKERNKVAQSAVQKALNNHSSTPQVLVAAQPWQPQLLATLCPPVIGTGTEV